jgi:hypothetical protein
LFGYLLPYRGKHPRLSGAALDAVPIISLPNSAFFFAPSYPFSVRKLLQQSELCRGATETGNLV